MSDDIISRAEAERRDREQAPKALDEGRLAGRHGGENPYDWRSGCYGMWELGRKEGELTRAII